MHSESENIRKIIEQQRRGSKRHILTEPSAPVGPEALRDQHVEKGPHAHLRDLNPATAVAKMNAALKEFVPELEYLRHVKFKGDDEKTADERGMTESLLKGIHVMTEYDPAKMKNDGEYRKEVEDALRRLAPAPAHEVDPRIRGTETYRKYAQYQGEHVAIIIGLAVVNRTLLEEERVPLLTRAAVALGFSDDQTHQR